MAASSYLDVEPSLDSVPSIDKHLRAMLQTHSVYLNWTADNAPPLLYGSIYIYIYIYIYAYILARSIYVNEQHSSISPASHRIGHVVRHQYSLHQPRETRSGMELNGMVVSVENFIARIEPSTGRLIVVFTHLRGSRHFHRLTSYRGGATLCHVTHDHQNFLGRFDRGDEYDEVRLTDKWLL